MDVIVCGAFDPDCDHSDQEITNCPIENGNEYECYRGDFGDCYLVKSTQTFPCVWEDSFIIYDSSLELICTDVTLRKKIQYYLYVYNTGDSWSAIDENFRQLCVNQRDQCTISEEVTPNDIMRIEVYNENSDPHINRVYMSIWLDLDEGLSINDQNKLSSNFVTTGLLILISLLLR